MKICSALRPAPCLSGAAPMGTGPGTGVIERTVTVTPDTSVQLVVRDEQDWSRASMTGFREMPFELSRLKPGDFVTVTTRRERPVAVSIEVWRPNATP